MTVPTAGARHRASRRPSTPLSTFGQVLTGSAARRGMIVAASSGLAITMAASSALANPDGANAPQADLRSLSLEARTALVSPTVSVPADVEFTIESTQALATPPKSIAGADPIAARVAEIAAEKAAAEAAARAAAEAAAAEAAAAERAAEARAADVASRSGSRQQAPARAQSQAPARSQAAAAPAPARAAAPAQNFSSGSVIDIAYRYVGTPYVWGGATPAGFDCSGFTSYVFAQVGIDLPRSSAAQRNAGRVVSASEARPGDLVWWPGHVGIYLGDGQHIAARNPSKPLQAGPISHVGRGAPTFIRVG